MKTLTKHQIDDLKDELKQYGYSESAPKLIKLISHPDFNRNITLLYSMIDYTGREEVAKRTGLKFKSTLQAIALICKRFEIPQPSVNIIMGDTLQRHNFPNMTPETFETEMNKRKGDLAGALGLSINDMFNGSVEYKLDEQSFNLNVGGWNQLYTENVQKFVESIQDKLSAALKDRNALQNLCNDQYLFNTSTGILKDEISVLKDIIMTKSGIKDRGHKHLVNLSANLSFTAISFLKHTLKEKEGIDSSLDTKNANIYNPQKETLISHELFEGKGLEIFAAGITYVMEETRALAEKPDVYIYGAGSVNMHKTHPYYELHELFELGKRPAGYMTAPEFNSLDEEQLEAYKTNYEHGQKNQKPPKTKSIAIPSVQNGESSSSAAAGNTSPKSLPSSYGSNASGIITPPEVRAVRRNSVGGSGSGHSSDSEHSEGSKKSGSEKKSIFAVTKELLELTDEDVHPKILEDAAKEYSKRYSNASASSNSSQHTSVANVVSIGGGYRSKSRSRSQSPGDNNNNNANNNNINTVVTASNQAQTEQQGQNNAQPPTSPKQLAITKL